MEYLVLAGSQLQESLAGKLGAYAPLFWSVIAPVGLFIVWAGSLYALWETWFRDGSRGERGGGGFLKVLFTLVMIALILCSGTALEFLVLGGGHIHARVLAGVVDLVRTH